MGIASALFAQCLVMFALMAIGFVLYRTHLVSDSTTKDLGAILLNVVFPLVIVRSFWGKFTPDNLAVLGTTFLVSLAALAVAMAVARVFFPHDGVLEFSAAFSNAGFIGIPLVSATLGDDAVFYITCFIAELNVLQWTYGKWRITGSTSEIAPRAVLGSPMLIGFAAGVALFLLRVPLPDVAGDVLGAVAGLNSPLAMIILGAYLAQSSPRSLFGTPACYAASVARLVVTPLATIVLLLAVPCATDIKLALLIAAAAPTGSNVAVFCQQLGRSTEVASNTVCLSTLLSLATMPLVVGVAGAVL